MNGSGRADLVIRGGPVLTADPSSPRATAVAVAGDRIVWVGADRDVAAWIGPRTRVLALGGRALVPGFVESHAHLLDVATTVHEVDARTPPNRAIADVLAKLRAAAAARPGGAWIRAYGYDDTGIAERRVLTRADLDAAVPDHPVYVEHVSGHIAYVNTPALRLGRVDARTPEPAGGVIVRDSGTGEPTGELREPPAQRHVTTRIPPYDRPALRHGLTLAAREFLAAGVTTVHDMGHPWTADAVAALEEAAERDLPLRVIVYARDRLRDTVLAHGFTHPRLRLGGIKLVADGSIQGHTAALRDPYHDQPGYRGLRVLEPPELAARVAAAHARGWQVAVHGNGDAAIDGILDAYAMALADRPRADHRHRIEHCQAVRPDQLDRMAALGIHASFFVAHTHYWGDRHRDLFLGPRRAPRISPLRSAQRRGIRFGLHSDAPVTPVSPLLSMTAAVTRRTASGKVLGPTERVSVQAALAAVTLDAAALGFDETRLGSITPGKLADLAVLTADPERVPADELANLRVETTIIGGEIAYP